MHGNRAGGGGGGGDREYPSPAGLRGSQQQSISSSQGRGQQSPRKGSTFDISFTPHFKALTNSGKSHFSRVADATAELIDNSIQATSDISLYGEPADPKTRKITVGLYTRKDKTAGKKGFMMVCDNGRGMDQEGLTAFATYSLDQESRGQAPRAGDKTFISRFGVGAKQAGFYLGSRIRVLTKPRGPQDHYYDLVLDTQDFQDRYDKSKDDVFKCKGLVEDMEITNQTPEERPFVDMFRDIDKFKEANNSFTIILISLHDYILTQLYGSDVNSTGNYGHSDGELSHLHNDLAEIYHFHLHSDHSPNDLVMISKFQPPANHADRIPDFPYPKKLKNNNPVDEESEHLPPIEMIYCLHEDGVNKRLTNLKSEKDFVTECISSAETAFRFDFGIPDMESASSVPRSLSQYSSSNKTFHVQGVLFYFPYRNGAESVPSRKYRQSEADSTSATIRYTQGGGGISSSATAAIAASQMSARGVDVADLERDKDPDFSPNFSVYWQNRLVPESWANRLPFFPDTMTSAKNESKRMCDDLGISEKWRGRIKGFLFFGWEFRHISNNKLKLQIGSNNLDDWLNDKIRVTKMLTFPTSATVYFKSFLKLSHERFDQEHCVLNRDKDLAEQLQLNRVGNTNAYFKTLNVGRGKYVITKNDVIKIKKKNRKIMVRVLGFEVTDSSYIEDNTDKYFGKANIVYHREPVEIFGPGPCNDRPSLSVIDFDDNFKVKESELKQLQESVPRSFEVQAYNDVDSEPILMVPFSPAGKLLKLLVGTKFQRISIKILGSSNGSKKNAPATPICAIPQTGRVYTVQATISQDGKVARNFGFTDDLWKDEVKVPNNELVKETASASLLQSCYYGVYSLRFETVGTYDLQIKLLTKLEGEELFEVKAETFRLVVVTPPPPKIDKFVITCDEVVERERDREKKKKDDALDIPSLVPVGDFLPTLSISCLDKTGAPVPYEGHVKVVISSDQFATECGNYNQPIFSLEKREMGSWPLCNFKLIPRHKSDFKFKEKQERVKFKVELSVQPQSSRDKNAPVEDHEAYTESCGPPQYFYVTVRPGAARKCKLSSPLLKGEGSVPMVLNQPLPQLIFKCYDSFDNLTYPWHPPPEKQMNKLVFEDSDNSPISWREFFPNSKGEVIASDYQLRDGFGLELLPQTGLDYKQKLSFWSFIEASEPNQKSKFQKTMEFDLRMHITPDRYPEKLAVYCGDDLIEGSFSSLLGRTITNLRFVVLDNHGNEFEINSEQHCRPKGTGLLCSWAPGKKSTRSKPAASGVLPDIILPNSFPSDGSSQVEYEVDLILCSDYNITGSFAVTLLPGEPVSWTIEASRDIDDGISNGEVADLYGKICDVTMRDTGNAIVARSSLDLVPEMVVLFAAPEFDSVQHNTLSLDYLRNLLGLLESDGGNGSHNNCNSGSGSGSARRGRSKSIDRTAAVSPSAALKTTAMTMMMALENNEEEVDTTPRQNKRKGAPDTDSNPDAALGSSNSNSNSQDDYSVLANFSSAKKSNTGSSVSSPGQRSLASEEIKFIKLAMSRKQDGRPGFVISANQTLEIARSTPLNIWIIVYDKALVLTPSYVSTRLISGYPNKIGFSSESLQLNVESNNSDSIPAGRIHVSKYTTIGDLKIHALDCQNRSPVINQNVRKLEFSISNSIDGQVVFSSNPTGRESNKVMRSVDSLSIASILARRKATDGSFRKKGGTAAAAAAVAAESSDSFDLICDGKFVRPDMSVVTMNRGVLNCTVIKQNVVGSLVFKIYKQNQEFLSQQDQGQQNIVQLSTFEMCCDDNFPIIHVYAETDDGIPFIPPLSSLNFFIKFLSDADGGSGVMSAKQKERSYADISNEFEVKPNVGMNCLQIIRTQDHADSTSPLAQVADTKSGFYVFDFTYKEKRESISALIGGPSSKVHGTLDLRVLAGRPCSVSPIRAHAGKLINISAVHSAQSKAVDRRLVDGVEFKVFDQFGNPCTVPSEANIVCRLMPKESSSAGNGSEESMDDNSIVSVNTNSSSSSSGSGKNSSLPKLSDNGYACFAISGQASESGKSTFFRSLTVGPSESVDGSYFVGEMTLSFYFAKIAFQSNSPTGKSKGGGGGGGDGGGGGALSTFLLGGKDWKYQIDESIAPYSVNVSFGKDDNEGKQLIVNNLQSEYKQLSSELAELQATKFALQNDVKTVEMSIKSSLTKSSSNLSIFKQRQNDIDVAELLAHKSTLIQQVSDMRSMKPNTRKAVLPTYPNKSILAKYNYKGMVAELGFIDDEFQARLLSWVGEAFMDCIVVDDTETAKQLYQQGIKSCALDSYRSFQLQEVSVGSKRARSAVEMRDGMLPLPSLNEVPGHPQYLINLIRLQPQLEYLRDTLFYAIYKDSLLFDTLDSALNYKRKCFQQNRQVGNLYTLQGDRILSNGILNPDKSAKLEGARLRFVYGQFTLDNTDDIAALENDIRILSDIEPAVRHRVDLSARQQAGADAHTRSKHIKEQMESIKDKLAHTYGVRM